MVSSIELVDHVCGEWEQNLEALLDRANGAGKVHDEDIAAWAGRNSG